MYLECVICCVLDDYCFAALWAHVILLISAGGEEKKMRSPARKRISRRFGGAQDDGSASILGAGSMRSDDFSHVANEYRFTPSVQLEETNGASNDGACPSDEETAGKRSEPSVRNLEQSRSYYIANNEKTAVQYGTADADDSVSMLHEDYLSEQAVAELATDNIAVQLERATREDERAPPGRIRFYEETERAREMKKEVTTDFGNDDDDDTTVQRDNNTERGLCDKSRGVWAWVCLSFSAVFAYLGADFFLFDEDDAVAIAALAKSGAEAGGAAAAASAAQ